MKRKSKNIFFILLICSILILLTGCGKNDNKNINDIINKIENANRDDDKGNNQDSKDISNDYDNIELYSDDTKIVYNMEDLYYIIFYHNGKDITGLEYIYEYPDRETAKFFETTLKATYEAEEDVEKVEFKGTKLIIKFRKSAYEGQTLESVKQAYSYLKEIKEN